MIRFRLAAAALLIAGVALFNPSPVRTVQHTTLTRVESVGTATYHYFGPVAITTCQQPPPGYSCNSGGVWWKVTANIAGWQNSVNGVVFASSSGYPHCTASGWNVTITGCTFAYSGTSGSVTISWQNCIPPFGIGCWSDFATMTFNNRGQYVSYRESWADAYP